MVWIIVLVFAIAVAAVFGILRPPMRDPSRSLRAVPPVANGGPGDQRAALEGPPESLSAPVPEEMRSASSRLLVALILIGLGAALLIVVAIRWLGGVLKGILS